MQVFAQGIFKQGATNHLPIDIRMIFEEVIEEFNRPVEARASFLGFLSDASAGVIVSTTRILLYM